LNVHDALPVHGRMNCSLCYREGESAQEIGKWRMRRDPGAWGNSNPKYLVLGFSKGATQADIYANGAFDDVAFGGKITRRNLTSILQTVGLLKPDENVDQKICSTDQEFHFGSLVRCSLSRYDEKESVKRGRPVYATSGSLITKSFSEIPHIVDRCSRSFLAALPTSIKVVVMLGVTEAYVRNCRKKVRELHPIGFRDINPIAYEARGILWVHLTHPSKGNGTLNAWLTREVNDTSGRKSQLAVDVIRARGLG
jgi:hypothetical protein